MHYGGVERVVFWLIRYFIQEGFKISLLTHEQSVIKELLPHVNVIIYPKSDDYRKYLTTDIDFVHIHDEHNEKLIPDKPYLATCHTNRAHFKKHYDNTVFVSGNHARNHGANYYVYNGIPVEEYPLLTRKKKELLFLAVLNMRSKNATTAINLAFDNNIKINLTGGSLLKSRQAMGLWVARLPWHFHHIVSHGFVNGDLKTILLQEALCLFYMVKWMEPFAIAAHEALACGTPVLGSPNGALPEYIQNNQNGFIAKSYEEGRDYIKSLLNLSEKEQADLAQRCRASAFTIEKCAQDYLNIYEQILRQNGRLYSDLEQPSFDFKPSATLRLNHPFWR